MSDRLHTAAVKPPEPERFRRRQFVAPHRRRKLIVRLAKPFLAALALVGLPVALVAWILLSEQFTVAEVEVSSGSRVSAEWASVRLSALEGRQLLEVGLADVASALGEHPWIEGVLLRRRPPNRLVVEILEREPAALLARRESLLFIDRIGRPIGAYDPAADPGDLVIVSTTEDRPELVHPGVALVGEWQRRRLPWGEELSEVHVLTATDFRVVSAVLPCPLFVSSLHLAEGLASLLRYAPQIEQRLAAVEGVGAIDLRFQGRIVLQPAAERSPNPEGETNA